MSALSSAHRTRERKPPGTPIGPEGIGPAVISGGKSDSADAVGGREIHWSASWTKAAARVAVDVCELRVPSCCGGKGVCPDLILTVNVLPLPSLLFTCVVPPCAPTNSCTRARPKPLPSG